MKFNQMIPELAVDDLQASLNFYKCCGFKIEYERPEDKFAFLSMDETQFMIQEIETGDKWDVGPMIHPYGNGINFQIEIKNADEIYNRLIENGYKIAFEMEENWYRQDNVLLGSKEFLVQDPDGYLLRFAEDLGEKDAV